MKSTQNFAAPAWLLKNFGCSPNNEMLMGDLDESIKLGKSAAWYWRQAIVAIFVGASVAVKRQPATILRAIAAGWLIFWPLGWLSFNFVYVLALVTLGLDEPDLLIGSWAPPFAWHTAAFGRIYTFAMNAIASGLLFGVGLISGYLLALLFKPLSRPTVLFFSGTVFLSWIVYSASLGADAVGATLPWSLYFWMNSIVQSICILLGGLIAETMARYSAKVEL